MQPQTNTVNVLDHGFVTLRNLAGPTRRPDQAFDACDIDPAQAIVSLLRPHLPGLMQLFDAWIKDLS